MSHVVAQVAPVLKAAGFRKRRQSFNRSTEPGLVQVLNFQMSAFGPPGPGAERNREVREAIGLAAPWYGRFTLNLGVWVGEMVIEEREKRDDWINEYNCHLRKRIGSLLETREDVWWSLEDPDVAATGSLQAIRQAGLPWLDRIASRNGILAAYECLGRQEVGLPPAAPVQIAWLLRDRDRQRAETMLRTYLEEPLSPGIGHGWRRGFAGVVSTTSSTRDTHQLPQVGVVIEDEIEEISAWFRDRGFDLSLAADGDVWWATLTPVGNPAAAVARYWRGGTPEAAAERTRDRYEHEQ
jgi:Domain of unknown function (DUF4304)